MVMVEADASCFRKSTTRRENDPVQLQYAFTNKSNNELINSMAVRVPIQRRRSLTNLLTVED